MEYTTEQVEAIVIAGIWPGDDNGARIAQKASLNVYLKRFSRVHYISIYEDSFKEMASWLSQPVEWIHIKTSPGPEWWRFLRSLPCSRPAIAFRYATYRRRVLQVIRRIAQKASGRLVIIIENVPVACLAADITALLPHIPVAVRSFDVLSKACAKMPSAWWGLKWLAWNIELRKIISFEKQICEKADKLWAITENEGEVYKSLLSVHVDGIVGVSMDTERYARVPRGDEKTVVYIGGCELFHKMGLEQFIKTSWPRVIMEIPEARFLVAGQGSKSFTNTKLRIQGLGRVGDDRDLLSQGAIFVCPQEIGAGIQIKCIVAMLSGKSLISTPMGAEGLAGMNGEHFIAAEMGAPMALQITDMMKNPATALKMGNDARALAQKFYSAQHLEEQVIPLLDEFLAKPLKTKANSERNR